MFSTIFIPSCHSKDIRIPEVPEKGLLTQKRVSPNTLNYIHNVMHIDNLIHKNFYRGLGCSVFNTLQFLTDHGLLSVYGTPRLQALAQEAQHFLEDESYGRRLTNSHYCSPDRIVFNSFWFGFGVFVVDPYGELDVLNLT